MEKTTKLADLKLVNKYYPSISNYSYPRPDATHRGEQPVNGRSSVGSECSVPEMVEDQESDVSVDDSNQSHIAGDETFDSFWEDSESFWGVEPGDNSNTVLIGPITHATALQHPADSTIPEKDRHNAPQKNSEHVNDHDSEPCWPLVAAEPTVAPAPKPSKPTYSLFPQPTVVAQQSLQLRRPVGQMKSEILWDAPQQYPSTVSLSLTNRRKKPRKLHLPASDGAISYDSSLLTQSAPGTPTLLIASPTAVAFSRRSQQTLPSQRNLSISRTHSDTKMVYWTPTDAPSQGSATQLIVPSHAPEKPRGRQTHQRTQSQLRQSISATDLPETPRPTPSPVESAVSHAPCGASRPTTPLAQQTVMPVSVFESDSDSDDDNAANFARRIVKNLTPHKRARSASAAPRSRKGSDIAKEQLRRIRADTISSSTDAKAAPAVEFETEDKENESPVMPVLRRQKSEVFGTIFGRKR
ncbi:hypothetical protein N8I77_010177 [Diaporthe amygdali]|uniref:Uncharacterized protein n=1 Tax=Phomopsis amygdali TaxID=1214568 RepID=A0AAD9VZ47_PHOAM|nr:hypothetical protein N8I77_010177 [Diaporthe amygdali]